MKLFPFLALAVATVALSQGCVRLIRWTIPQAEAALDAPYVED